MKRGISKKTGIHLVGVQERTLPQHGLKASHPTNDVLDLYLKGGNHERELYLIGFVKTHLDFAEARLSVLLLLLSESLSVKMVERPR